jgi:hypothetical protein
VEPLYEHVEFQDVPIKFCVRIFRHFKSIFKTKFKNREHMLPGAKTPLPFLPALLSTVNGRGLLWLSSPCRRCPAPLSVCSRNENVCSSYMPIRSAHTARRTPSWITLRIHTSLTRDEAMHASSVNSKKKDKAQYTTQWLCFHPFAYYGCHCSASLLRIMT